MEDRARLGKMLVDEEMLTEEQLRMAMDFQKSVGGKLGAIIVKLGFIEDERLTGFIAKQQDIPSVQLDELVLPENLVKKVPRKLVERHHILPIHYEDGVLTVATSDPFDFEAMEELQLALNYKIEINLAPRSAILKSINELYNREEAPPKTEKTKEELLRELEGDEKKTKHKVSPLLLKEALIPLLIEKGIISEEELAAKAMDLQKGKAASA